MPVTSQRGQDLLRKQLTFKSRGHKPAAEVQPARLPQQIAVGQVVKDWQFATIKHTQDSQGVP